MRPAPARDDEPLENHTDTPPAPAIPTSVGASGRTGLRKRADRSEDRSRSAIPARTRSGFAASLPLLFGVLIFFQVLAYGGRVLGDPDTYLHVAVGRWILAHHTVPHRGILSATMAGAPWVAHEWLSEVALAWLYGHFGWTGPVAATALCTAAALALLLRLLLRSLVPLYATIAAVMAYLTTLPHVLARPDIFALPILVFWAGALVAARARDRAPPLRTAGLMTVWANLHGGYMFGLALAALFAGEAVLTAADRGARRRAGRAWALFGVASLAAAAITPYGLAGLLLPFRLMRMKLALSLLIEWRSPDFATFQPLEAWLMLFLLAALALGWRLPWTRAVMLLLLLHMALQHRRFGELLGLVAPLLLAPALAGQLEALARRGPASRLDDVMEALARPAGRGAIALALLLLLAATAAIPPGALRPGAASTPAAAVAAVEARHVAGPVLNSYGFGDYLIISGIRPFIDGRAELYGDAFIRRYVAAVSLAGDALPQLLRRYRIQWTLLAPESPAVALLDHLPGWKRLYADPIAVVHVRKDAPGR
jgi:hypothetical protein